MPFEADGGAICRNRLDDRAVVDALLELESEASGGRGACPSLRVGLQRARGQLVA